VGEQQLNIDPSPRLSAMEQWNQWWPAAGWILPITLLTLGILFYRGRLSRRALVPAPSRQTGLGGLDLIFGLLALVVGVFLQEAVAQAATQLGWAGDGEAVWGPGRSLVMLAQYVAGMAPPVGYFLWKAGTAWGSAAAHEPGWRRGWREAGLVPERPGGLVGDGVLGFLAAVPLVMGTMLLVQALGILIDQPAPTIGHGLLEVMQGVESPVALAILLVTTIVVAPVLEELVFRGFLQSGLYGLLGPNRRWLIIFVAAAVFAPIHLGAATWHALPALFVLAVVLGYLYERSGSLLPPIIAHLGFNALNVGLVLLAENLSDVVEMSAKTGGGLP